MDSLLQYATSRIMELERLLLVDESGKYAPVKTECV